MIRRDLLKLANRRVRHAAPARSPPDPPGPGRRPVSLARGGRRRTGAGLGRGAERRHPRGLRRRALRRRPRRPEGRARPARQDPGRHPARRPPLQPVAGCRASPRLVAAHDGRRVPQGRSRLGGAPRPRRAGPRRGPGLGVERRREPAGQPRPGARPALPRWRRRHGGARVRPRDPLLRRGRLLAAGSQEHPGLARSRHAAAGEPARRAGARDAVGLRPHRAAVAARNRPGSGACLCAGDICCSAAAGARQWRSTPR